MCYDEGVFQELIDGEYEGDGQAVFEHLKTCETCRRMYQTLLEQETYVREALSTGLSAGAEFATPQKRMVPDLKIGRKHRMKKIHWGYKTAAAAALCGIMVFTAPGAALADQLLKVFRTENIEAVSLTPDDLSQIQRIFNDGSGKCTIDNIGKFEASSSGEQKTFENMADISALKALMPDVKTIPLTGTMKYTSGHFAPRTDVRFTLDVKRVNEMLRYMGKQTFFPESLDQKTFSIATDRAIGYSVDLDGQGKKLLNVATSGMPEVMMPEGVSHSDVLKVLEDTGLLPRELSQKLAGIGSLESVLPVPYLDTEQNKKEIEINGQKAIVIENRDGKYFEIFVKDGANLYFFSGNGITADEAIKVIETLE